MGLNVGQPILTKDNTSTRYETRRHPYYEDVYAPERKALNKAYRRRLKQLIKCDKNS